jgi:hypothetical protein
LPEPLPPVLPSQLRSPPAPGVSPAALASMLPSISASP